MRKDQVTWNITEIARIFGCHRDTVRKHLKDAEITPCAKKGSVPVYDPVEVGRALFAGENGL